MKQAPQHEPGDILSLSLREGDASKRSELAGDARPRAGRTFADPADVEPRSPRGRGYSNQLGFNRAMEDGKPFYSRQPGPRSGNVGRRWNMGMRSSPTSRLRGDETNLGFPRSAGEMSEGQRGHTLAPTNQTTKTCNPTAGHFNTYPRTRHQNQTTNPTTLPPQITAHHKNQLNLRFRQHPPSKQIPTHSGNVQSNRLHTPFRLDVPCPRHPPTPTPS